MVSNKVKLGIGWILGVLLVVVACVQMIVAQPVTQTVNRGQVTLANGTSVTVAVTGASQTVTLTALSDTVTISFPAGGATYLYFNPFGGAATTANFAIPAGTSYTFNALPSLTSFTVLGASASGNFSVLAH